MPRRRNALTTLLWMNLICVVPITLVLFSVAPEQTWERFWRIGVLVAVVANINFVLLTILRRQIWPRLHVRDRRLLYLGLSVGILPVIAAISAAVSQVILAVFPWRPVPTFVELMQINVPLVVVYGLAYFLMGDYRHRLARVNSDLYRSRRSNVALELERNEMKLFALQVFLKPHFLFNSLNTISALIHENPAKAEEALILLARVLRRIVEMRNTSKVAFESELAIVTEYLSLEQIRLGDRLTVSVEVPPEMLRIRVPAMIMQPIVENAVQHGIRQRKEGGHIRIRAAMAGPDCRIEIIDNGPGVSSHHGTGEARRLLQDRLDALYGRGRYEMSLIRDDGRGETIALLTLPVRLGTQVV